MNHYEQSKKHPRSFFKASRNIKRLATPSRL